MFKPLRLMFDRVRNFSDNDSALFTELLYAGEFILRLTTSAFVCVLDDDREKNRYRLIHGLVRANGIGEWSRALDETFTGTASQNFPSKLNDTRRIYTERVGKGSWQHEAVSKLQEVLDGVTGETTPAIEKIALRNWFQAFAELRNKTRGHGAVTPATAARLAKTLNETISILGIRSPIFSMPWVYLHRNMSGKYTVIDLEADASQLDRIKPSSIRRTTIILTEYTSGMVSCG